MNPIDDEIRIFLNLKTYRRGLTKNKFFSSVELEKMWHDKDWLSKATLAVSDYWQKKNARKSKAALQPRTGQ